MSFALTKIDSACSKCARPLTLKNSEMTCFACLKDHPVYDGMKCAYIFDENMRSLLWKVKFKKEFSHLAKQLVQTDLSLSFEADLVIPLPLSPWRLWTRKFNQSQLIAQALAKQHSIRLASNILKRKFSLGHQSALSLRERKSYLKNKFYTKKSIAGKNILLVDDVVTTAYTVSEAALVLKKAGANQVYVWALARTLKKR